jgi:hypothetical protein
MTAARHLADVVLNAAKNFNLKESVALMAPTIAKSTKPIDVAPTSIGKSTTLRIDSSFREIFIKRVSPFKNYHRVHYCHRITVHTGARIPLQAFVYQTQRV